MIIENDIDLNVGDELKLFYSHSFLNSKGSSIRVFKDTQGRNFNTYPRSNTNYKDLKLNQEVVHFVSKIAENGYPKLIEKINFDFRFGEFKEGDHVILNFVEDSVNVRGVSVRTVKDKSGREFTHSLEYPTQFPDPEHDQEIKYFVTKVSIEGVPAYRETQTDYEAGEFKEGDQVILNFVEDSVNVRGVSVRTVKDKSGREFTHNLEYPTQFPEPEKDQEIKYFVKEISPQFKPKFWELKKARYEIGDYLDLEVVEDKKIIKKINGTQTMFRILRDKNYPDELLHIPLLPFQSGEKYISPEEGKIIRYEVIDLFPDNTIKFKELNSTNPYFISLESFTKNTQEIFNLDYLNSHSALDQEIEMEERYRLQDSNWVISFINKIYLYLSDALNQKKYQESINIAKCGTEILTNIDDSGFLAVYQKEITRKNTENFLKKRGLYFQNIVEIFSSIYNSEDIDNFIQALIDEQVNFDDSRVKILLATQRSAVSNENIEKLVESIKNNKDFFGSESSILLITRRKEIRNSLFHNKSVTDHIDLKNDLDIKHLIYLEKLELKRKKLLVQTTVSSDANERKFKETEALLSEANILRLKGYYHDDPSYVEKSVDILKEGYVVVLFIENIGARKHLIDNFKFELLANYKFLISHSTDTKTIIKFLKETFQIYKDKKSFRSYVHQGLLKYYKIILMVENGKSLAEIQEKCFKNYQQYIKKGNETLVQSDPILKELFDMYRIIGNIGSDEYEDKFFLLEKSTQIYEKDFFHNKALSSLILSGNLLTELTMQNDLLKEELFKVLRGVSLEIKGSVLFSENDEIIEKEDALAIKDINSNEKHTLEFKGSYSLDVKAYCQKEKIYSSSSDLSFGIFKTIAGMLNSDEGGKLYIGVLEISKKPFDLEEYQIKLQDRMNGIKLKDKKMIIGIENELHEKSWDIDDYISSIHSGISNKIDVDVENFVTINTINFRDKIVCQVTVEDGACYNRDEGWWVTNEKDPSPKYCLRQDNKTVTFDFKEGMKQLSIMNKKVERKKALGFQNNAQITNGELSEN